MLFFSTLLTVLMATIALAKQVASPLKTFDLHRAGDPNNKEGHYWDRWELDFTFALQPMQDNVQPGDYFQFTLDKRFWLGDKPYDFDVVDPNGNPIYHVKNDGFLFTCTYSDYVADKNWEINGTMRLTATAERNEIKEAGWNSFHVDTGNGTGFDDSINIVPELDVTQGRKWGARFGDDEYIWYIQLPKSPYHTLRLVDTLRDDSLAFPDMDTLWDGMRVNLGYNMDEFWNTDKWVEVPKEERSKYVTLDTVEGDTFTATLHDIPDDVNVQLVFTTKIVKPQTAYWNHFGWEMWMDASGGEGPGNSIKGDTWGAGNHNQDGSDFDGDGEGDGKSTTLITSTLFTNTTTPGSTIITFSTEPTSAVITTSETAPLTESVVPSTEPGLTTVSTDFPSPDSSIVESTTPVLTTSSPITSSLTSSFKSTTEPTSETTPESTSVPETTIVNSTSVSDITSESTSSIPETTVESTTPSSTTRRSTQVHPTATLVPSTSESPSSEVSTTRQSTQVHPTATL
ncbi:hypothetical protein B0I72DRAFT_148701, partial [Yarrowia lipolytica]